MIFFLNTKNPLTGYLHFFIKVYKNCGVLEQQEQSGNASHESPGRVDHISLLDGPECLCGTVDTKNLAQHKHHNSPMKQLSNHTGNEILSRHVHLRLHTPLIWEEEQK